MRALLFTVLLTVLSLSIHSKDSARVVNKFNRAIGINLLSSEYLSADSPFMPSSDLVIFPGIYYHENWNKNALRISLGYAKKTFHTPPNPPNLFLSDSLHTVKHLFDLRIGYQRSFGHCRLVRPYVFSELMTRALHCNGSWNDRMNDVRDPMNYRVFSGGLTLGAGLQVVVWRTLSVCYEADACCLVGKRYDLDTKARRDSYDLIVHQIRTLGISWGF